MINGKNRGITLTSVIGDFTFDSNVILSHAKLVRDTLVAVFLGADSGGLRPPKPEAAQLWVSDHMNGSVKDTQFELTLRRS